MKTFIIASLIALSLPSFAQAQSINLELNDILNEKMSQQITQEVNTLMSRLETPYKFDALLENTATNESSSNRKASVDSSEIKTELTSTSLATNYRF